MDSDNNCYYCTQHRTCLRLIFLFLWYIKHTTEGSLNVSEKHAVQKNSNNYDFKLDLSLIQITWLTSAVCEAGSFSFGCLITELRRLIWGYYTLVKNIFIVDYQKSFTIKYLTFKSPWSFGIF